MRLRMISKKTPNFTLSSNLFHHNYNNIHTNTYYSQLAATTLCTHKSEPTICCSYFPRQCKPLLAVRPPYKNSNNNTYRHGLLPSSLYSTTRSTIHHPQRYQFSTQTVNNTNDDNDTTTNDGMDSNTESESEAQIDSRNDVETILEQHLPSPLIVRRILHMVDQHETLMSHLLTTNTTTDTTHETTSSSSSSTILSTNEVQTQLTTLTPIYTLYKSFQETMDEIHSLQQLQTDAKCQKDDEIYNECLVEIEQLQNELMSISSMMMDTLLHLYSKQQDTNSSSSSKEQEDLQSDAILEIRAGTGGDEASLFAMDLLEAYRKIVQGKNKSNSSKSGWNWEILELYKTDLGGLKEASVSISSSSSSMSSNYGTSSTNVTLDDFGPYGFFKFESGVHRVQRVPINDVRIHTSAASVAILPALSQDSDSSSSSSSLLPTNELKIETMRASGAGGQHVNTTESAVRITHIPTGITATIQDERSQHKNKAKAMKLITARVRDKIRIQEEKKRGDVRNSLMGGGDRSERVRTYNYPQDRITDHRCKHSEHGIEKLLGDGGSGEYNLVTVFAPHLRKMEKDELLRMMMEDEERKSPGDDDDRLSKKKAKK